MLLAGFGASGCCVEVVATEKVWSLDRRFALQVLA